MEHFIRDVCLGNNSYPTLYVSRIALGWLEEKLKVLGLQIDEIEDTLIEDSNGETMEVLLINLNGNPLLVSWVFTTILNFFSHRRLFITDQPQALNHDVLVKQDNVITKKYMKTVQYYLMGNADRRITTTLNIGLAYPWHQSWCGKYRCPPSDSNGKLYREQFERFDLFDLCLMKISMRGANVNRKSYNMIRDLIKKRMNNIKGKITVREIDESFFKRDCTLNLTLIYYLVSQFPNKFSNLSEAVVDLRPEDMFRDALKLGAFLKRIRSQRDAFSTKVPPENSYLSIEFNRITPTDNSPNIMKHYTERQKLKYLTPKRIAYIDIDWKRGVQITLANFTIENWNFISQYVVRQITLKNIQFTKENLMQLIKLDFKKNSRNGITRKLLEFIACSDLHDMMLLEFVNSMSDDIGISKIKVLDTNSITKFFHYSRAMSQIGENDFYNSEDNLPLVDIEELEDLTLAKFYKKDDKLMVWHEPRDLRMPWT